MSGRWESALAGATVGLSAKAISGTGKHHPWDPADLVRCVAYCERNGITVDELRARMAGKSPWWDALLWHWGGLVAMLRDEVEYRTDGKAPVTYRAMRFILDEVDAQQSMQAILDGTEVYP